MDNIYSIWIIYSIWKGEGWIIENRRKNGWIIFIVYGKEKGWIIYSIWKREGLDNI